MRLAFSSEKYRIPSLDGLRALSILIVILRHFYSQDYFNPNCRYISILFDGQFGVNVFFVISGFLITSLLTKEEEVAGSISLNKFYLRRALRILPAFFFLLLFYGILQYFEIIHISRDSWLTTLTFTKFLNGGTDWYTWHIWSLSVEEWFYLVWPLMFIRKNNRELILWSIVIIIPLIKLFSYFNLIPTISDLSILTRSDAIAMGCLLCFNRERIESILFKNSRYFYYFIFAVFFLLAIFYFNKNYELIKLLAIAFGGSHGTIANFLIGLILIKSITLKHGWWFRLLNHRIMVWIGTLSYSLYLWQQFFIHNSFNWYNSFPINLLLIVIFALTSYHFIEKPFLRLKSLI